MYLEYIDTVEVSNILFECAVKVSFILVGFGLIISLISDFMREIDKISNVDHVWLSVNMPKGCKIKIIPKDPDVEQCDYDQLLNDIYIDALHRVDTHHYPTPCCEPYFNFISDPFNILAVAVLFFTVELSLYATSQIYPYFLYFVTEQDKYDALSNIRGLLYNITGDTVEVTYIYLSNDMYYFPQVYLPVEYMPVENSIFIIICFYPLYYYHFLLYWIYITSYFKYRLYKQKQNCMKDSTKKH